MKIVGIVFLLVVLFIVVPFIMTLIWSWVVPDVFAGMVTAGLLPASITFVQALKLTALLAILGVTSHGSSK